MRFPFPFSQVMAPLTLNAVEPTRHVPGEVGDGHPTAFPHEQIAAQILPRIRGLTGW